MPLGSEPASEFYSVVQVQLEVVWHGVPAATGSDVGVKTERLSLSLCGTSSSHILLLVWVKSPIVVVCASHGREGVRPLAYYAVGDVTHWQRIGDIEHTSMGHLATHTTMGQPEVTHSMGLSSLVC